MASSSEAAMKSTCSSVNAAYIGSVISRAEALSVAAACRERLGDHRRAIASAQEALSCLPSPDLRTEIETSNVSGVFDGDIDQFVEGFLQWRRAQGDAETN